MFKEIWKGIPGYEGLYWISSLGRVRSASRGIVGIELTQRGYCRVTLSRGGIRKRFRVHRLVAIVFIPNPDNLPQVDHINGDKTDNRVDNLRWTTNVKNCNYNNKKDPQTGRVLVTSKDGNSTLYDSVRGAARAIGVSRYGIMAVLNGTQKTTANGTRVSYVN